MRFAKIEKSIHVVKAVLAICVVSMTAFVAGCGGGGGGGGSSSSSSGDNNGPSQQPIAANAPNTAAVTVDRGVANLINIPTVSVKICQPGTTNCTVVDHVLLDTGSFGVRIVNSALGSLSGALQPQQATAGGQLAECTHFADGFTWGTTRLATVQISGEVASNIPIQVIGDLPEATIPSGGCVNGAAENTAQALGANGIIGIGVAPFDCGEACSVQANVAQFSNYYACNGTNCVRTLAELTKQVANPVPNFPADNNGVIVQMAPISASGQASATGTVVFGIGTQSNNGQEQGITTYTTDASGDLVNSKFNGATTNTFMDSGSNGYFFQDGSMPLCTGNLASFYCPGTTQQRTVTLVGANNVTGDVSLNIANTQNLLSAGSNFAFNDLGGQIGSLSAFDLGLPFFFGRHVYYGMDKRASGGQAPFVAF